MTGGSGLLRAADHTLRLRSPCMFLPLIRAADRESPDLDFIHLLVVKGHEALDDKRQGVHSVSYGVDAGSLEEEVHPGPAARR